MMPKCLINILYTLFLLSIISGCAVKKTDPNDFKHRVEDRFSTDIRHKGIKLFTYTAKLAFVGDSIEQEPHRRRTEHAKRGKRTRTEDSLSDWTQQIELGLSKTLEMTGFCREGYIELSRLIEVGRGEIRGECNEGATQEDRDKFSS